MLLFFPSLFCQKTVSLLCCATVIMNIYFIKKSVNTIFKNFYFFKLFFYFFCIPFLVFLTGLLRRFTTCYDGGIDCQVKSEDDILNKFVNERGIFPLATGATPSESDGGHR